MRQWKYLLLSLDPSDQDKATGLLWDLGTQGIEEDRAQAQRVQIKAYFHFASDMRTIKNGFLAQCRKSRVKLFSTEVRTELEKDWFRKWRDSLRPFSVGSSYFVVPWRRREKRLPFIPENRFAIWLEPGMAFGTGTHETTQLCLEAMEHLSLSRHCVLDVGTGSGILAIAAAKLGAKRVVGCDTDPVAVDIARRNTTINDCGSRIRHFLGEARAAGRARFDLLVANLTVEIIEESLAEFEQRVKPRGQLILSGILSSQTKRLIPTSRNGSLTLQRTLRKGEWACIVLRREN